MSSKHIFIVVIGLVLLPSVSWSQSTLNFPAGVHNGELPNYGYAVVNPNATAATATFKLYAHGDGAELGSATMTVPAQGQVARLGSELFGNPAISSASWVQVTSATSGLQGFYIVGDFRTRVDGAEAATAATNLIFPFIGNTTELNIANPGSSTVTTTTQFFAADGTELLPAITRTVQPHGGFHSHLINLPNTGPQYATAKYMRVTSTGPVAGVSHITNVLVFGKDEGVVNGVSGASGSTQLNFPHVISGPLGSATYTTSISIANLTASSQTVTLTFTPISGSAVTVQRTIAGSGALVESAQQLFGLPGSFQNGWVQVSGSAGLAGVVAYADIAAGGLAIVPASTGAASTNVLFAHIADLDPWWTGLALLNTTSADAQIEVFAMTPSGALIGGAENVPAASFILPAGAKTSRLLSELIPQTQSRSSDGGFVYIRSTNGVPISGMELFFLRSGAAFANVSAGTVPAGITFTPPR